VKDEVFRLFIKHERKKYTFLSIRGFSKVRFVACASHHLRYPERGLDHGQFLTVFAERDTTVVCDHDDVLDPSSPTIR